MSALALLLAACSSHPEELLTDAGKDRPLSFTTTVDGSETTTRATTPLTPLQDTYTKFGVWTRKTVNGDVVKVMEEYIVEHNGSAWSYEKPTLGQYLKYWDSTATQYTFTAIAPGEVEETSGTKLASEKVDITVDDAGNMTLKNLSANVSTGDNDNSSNSIDWVVAKTIRTMETPEDEDGIDNTHTFPTPSARFDEVPLNFHHIYAKVDIKVYAKKPITIMSFKMMIPEGSDDKIPNKGNYDLTSGWSIDGVEQNDWLKRFADYTYYSTSGKSIPNDANKALVLCSHLQMPHTFPESGRTFNISFTDVNGNNYAGSITLNASNNGSNSWAKNKHYTYTLKINNDEGTSEVILFAVDMETWKWQAGNTTEDEQHNW